MHCKLQMHKPPDRIEMLSSIIVHCAFSVEISHRRFNLKWIQCNFQFTYRWLNIENQLECHVVRRSHQAIFVATICIHMLMSTIILSMPVDAAFYVLNWPHGRNQHEQNTKKTRLIFSFSLKVTVRYENIGHIV